MENPIPATIKVGPITYKIVFVHNLQSDGERQAMLGEHHRGLNEIRIDSNTPYERQVVTLWHELLHAMIDQITRSEELQEEDIVAGLAYQIYSLMQDNHQLKNLV